MCDKGTPYRSPAEREHEHDPHVQSWFERAKECVKRHVTNWWAEEVLVVGIVMIAIGVAAIVNDADKTLAAQQAALRAICAPDRYGSRDYIAENLWKFHCFSDDGKERIVWHAESR